MATYSPSKITKDGNTYNFTDDTKIPLAGTSALSGSIIPNADNSYDLGSSSYRFRYVYTNSLYSTEICHAADNEYLVIYSSTAWNKGATISLSGKDRSTNSGEFILDAHNGTSFNRLRGKPDGTLSWSGSAITYTSDRRIKDEINSIPDEMLDAWENLEPKQYKYKSDLEADKDTAQIHYGWIAQDVESVIKGDRKTEIKSGLWLHETWEEQEEVSHEEEYQEEVQTKDGKTETVIKTRKVIDEPYQPKGDSYGLRYTECLVVECAYLRKKNKELQEQLDKVIARLDKLESASTK